MISLMFGDVPESSEVDWKLVQDFMHPIASFYTDPGVTDIMVNRFDTIYVTKNNKKTKVDASFKDEDSLDSLINQLSRALDQDNFGILDAKLPDNSRVCATTKEVTPSGCTFTLRIAPKTLLSHKDLIDSGALTQEMFDFIISRLQLRDNISITGNVGSGKTSLLRAISKFIDPEDRMIICEDTQELFMDWFPDMIAMEAPKRKKDDPGHVIDLPFLIRTTLRQNGDRVWVGEIRDYLSCDSFFVATSAGFSGCACTAHANNVFNAISRYANLLVKGGNTTFELAKITVMEGIQLFIHCERKPSIGRKVTEIATCDGNEIKVIFKYDVHTGTHIRVD